MPQPKDNAGRSVAAIFLAALTGFILAEMVLLLVRVPSLLQPAHLGGFFGLLASSVILYAFIGVGLVVFLLLLKLISKLLRLHFTNFTLAIMSLILAPLFLIVQQEMQERILGMYVSLKSPLFYVPTLITLGILIVALVLMRFVLNRGINAPSFLRRSFAWPGLIGTAAVVFMLLAWVFGPAINVLGVFSAEEERAAHKERRPEQQIAAAPGSPNFIVLVIECLRSDQFTAENAPFMSKLAQENVFMPRYYVVSAATRPSVTSFFTSLYPAQHGCYNLALTKTQQGVKSEKKTMVQVASTIESMPKLLQDNGYRTVMISSNGLAADPAFGFEMLTQFDATEPYRFQVPSLEALFGFQFLKENLRLSRIFKIIVLAPDHSTTYFDAPRLNQTVKREMSRQDERPFLLYVHYMEPHSPYYFRPYKPVQINTYAPSQRDKILSAYASEIKAVDGAIEDLFGFLQEKGLLDNTYVLITSDHGEEFYDHRNWGHGKSVYPEVIGVPAVLVTPEGGQQARLDAVIESIDIAPTFAELASVPASKYWEGQSLLPLLHNQPDPAHGDRVSAGDSAAHRTALCQFDNGRVFWSSAIVDDWQIITRGRQDNQKVMLFNLAADPLAQQNLAGENQAKQEELIQLLQRNQQRLDLSAELFQGEEQVIDEAHIEQLRALGYVTEIATSRSAVVDGPRIPVLRYHSVGVKSPDWLGNSLTCPLELFRGQIELLQAKGYHCITLSDIHERQEASSTQTEREVGLTFDDGYLDNWVYAYPILKRQGWRGLIYVNPEFVDPGTSPRLNLEDVWEGRCQLQDLPCRGFLNWAELRLLAAGDVLEIGSHSMTHTWHPTGPAIIDYHRPGCGFPWLAWNTRPDRKHRYLEEDQSDFVPFGTPVHSNGRALGIRRYFPAAAQNEAAVTFVAQHGGAEFFARQEWRAQLDAVVGGKEGGAGEYESDQAMAERYRWEICESKRQLSEGIGREVRHFCWPGGVYNDISWRIAEQAGYQTIVASYRDPERWFSCDPHCIRRMDCHSSLSLRSRHFEIEDPRALYHACEVRRGNTRHAWLLRVMKVREALKRAI